MATIYVRKSGSDANDGSTEALAKLTIAGGESVLSSNDTLDIGEGIFIEDYGGVNNVTYQGAGMFKTIIRGTKSTTLVTGAIKDLTHEWTVVHTGVVHTGTFSYVRVFMNGGGFSTNAYMGAATGVTLNLLECVFFDFNFNSGQALVNFGVTGTLVFRYNTVHKLADTQLLRLNAGTIDVKNNVISEALVEGSNSILGNTTGATVTEDYNIYSEIATTPISGEGANSLEADPLWIDPDGGNFELGEDSPAIGIADPSVVRS